MGINEQHVNEFYEMVLKLKTLGDCKIFFEDVCTYKEIENMTQRIISAKLLLEGKTYEEIIRETEVSSATLSRVSKCVKYGKGYKKVLQNNE